MRIFNTAQELWSYCLFCPICQEPSRTITMSIGPDDEWRLAEFQKIGSELKILCSWQYDMDADDLSAKKRYSAVFTVDCDKNTYQLSLGGEDARAMIKVAENNSFYMYLHAKCDGCDNSYIDTSDIYFDPPTKTIMGGNIERDGVYLLLGENGFHIVQYPEQNIMMVSRITQNDGVMEEIEKVINLPIVNLDFSNVPKIINKIKTLILFS